MNLWFLKIFVTFHLCNYSVDAGSERALLYGLSTTYSSRTWSTPHRQLDVKHRRQCVTACPASTQREKKFNDAVSIAGNSLFIRNYYNLDPLLKSNELEEIELNSCDTPIMPSIAYRVDGNRYEVAYEIYYEDNETNSEIFYEGYQHHYHAFRSVNLNNNTINQMKPPSDFVTALYDNKRRRKLYNFTDGSRILIFHWKQILYIKENALGNKRIEFDDWDTMISIYYNFEDKCEDYHLNDPDFDYLFSEENQQKCLKDFLIPLPLPPSKNEKSSTPHCNYMKKSQIIPIWYSSSYYSVKLALCTRLNFVPIWKTIADQQLKKADLYLFLALQTFRFSGARIDNELISIEYNDLIFGVSGVLEMKNNANPEELRELHLTNEAKNHPKIPVPKVIYRMLKIRMNVDRAAVIVIHNDPNPIQESDRICSKESQVAGWEMITNEDTKSGLTYVCPLTREIIQKLALNNETVYPAHPLNLEWDFPEDIKDINEAFEEVIF